MESKRYQKLLEYYKAVLNDKPAFSLKLRQNVLPNDMKPIISFVFKSTEDKPLLKLCTTRASDYLMSECDIERDRKTNHRNEYIMLFSPEVEVSESANE